MGYRIKLTNLNGTPVLPELDCDVRMGVRELVFAASCLARRLHLGTMVSSEPVLQVTYSPFTDTVMVWGLHTHGVRVVREASESLELMEKVLGFKTVLPQGEGLQFAMSDSLRREVAALDAAGAPAAPFIRDRVPSDGELVRDVAQLAGCSVEDAAALLTPAGGEMAEEARNQGLESLLAGEDDPDEP